MITLDLDSALKAVEILRRSQSFSVRPRGDIGFIAQADGHAAFGETSLDAVIRLFQVRHPRLSLKFYIEHRPQDEVWRM